jgi:hypothetical protein
MIDSFRSSVVVVDEGALVLGVDLSGRPPRPRSGTGDPARANIAEALLTAKTIEPGNYESPYDQ